MNHEEIATFKTWCDSQHLSFNLNKTKEMIFDPREVRAHDPVIIGDSKIEQVCSYKYLGIHMDNKLKWSVHVEYLCS